MTDRRSPTQEELLEYAHEHLTYEIKMLRWTTAILYPISGIKTVNPLTWSCNCAFMTSYALHARNLIGFLYPPYRCRPTDIVVQQYIDITILSDPSQFPPITNILREAKAKADKQAAHLTCDRIHKYTGRAKTWPVRQITKDIISAFRSIAPHFPASLTSAQFREFLLQLHEDIPHVTTIPSGGQEIGVCLSTNAEVQF